MKIDYHPRNIYTKEQALTQLGSHEDVTIINTSLLIFYDINSFMNLLYKKYPPSTIIKSYFFTVYLQDLICMCAKIASNTTKVLVCALMKSLRKRAKLLISPILAHAQVLLQDRIVEYTTTNMCSPDDHIDNAILIVLVVVADILLCIPPMLGSLPPLPLGPPYSLPPSPHPPLLQPLLP